MSIVLPPSTSPALAALYAACANSRPPTRPLAAVAGGAIFVMYWIPRRLPKQLAPPSSDLMPLLVDAAKEINTRCQGVPVTALHVKKNSKGMMVITRAESATLSDAELEHREKRMREEAAGA